MAAVILNAPERRWECPSCDHTDMTRGTATGLPMHNCAGMHDLSVPLVPAGTKAHHRAVERQDYIGNELVQTDARGRPVMAVYTERPDGEDCTVYAPTAQVTLGDLL